MAAFVWSTPPPSSSSEESDDDNVEYTPETPYITELEQSSRRTAEYEPIFNLDETPKFRASFEMPMGISPTAEAMTEIYLPDSLLDKWVRCTNVYAASLGGDKAGTSSFFGNNSVQILHKHKIRKMNFFEINYEEA